MLPPRPDELPGSPRVRVLPRGPGKTSVAELLDLVSFIMDRLVQIPGTRLRVGLNTLLMAIPFVGDALASLVSLGILTVGLGNYRVPRIVAARMILNSTLDAAIGWIPVVGDLFDLFFKADTRNVRLLQEYIGQAEQLPRPTWRHWAFVLGLVGGFGMLLVLMGFAAVALVHYLLKN
jgi:hypothetical protein